MHTHTMTIGQTFYRVRTQRCTALVISQHWPQQLQIKQLTTTSAYGYNFYRNQSPNPSARGLWSLKLCKYIIEDYSKRDLKLNITALVNFIVLSSVFSRRIFFGRFRIQNKRPSNTKQYVLQNTDIHTYVAKLPGVLLLVFVFFFFFMFYWQSF